jgi:hypothetical protein
MKPGLTRTAPWLFLLTALLSVATPAHARSCKLSGVAGTYGYTTSGNIPTTGAVAAGERINFDASDNLTGVQTASFNGAIFSETLSGTYTVNADYAGLAVVNVYHSGVLVRTTNLDVIFENDQRELCAIFLTAGTVLTVSGKKTFHGDEDYRC